MMQFINRKNVLKYMVQSFVFSGFVLCGQTVYANDMLENSLKENIKVHQIPKIWGNISAFYNKTHNSQRNGFDLNVRGVGGYMQSQITDSFLMRLGYAYSDATAKVQTQKTDIDTDSYYIYGKFQPEKWYIAGQLGYHHASYKTKESEVEKGKADIYQSSFISGYHFGNVRNYSGLKYTYVDTDKKENLMIPRDNGEVLTAFIGTQYAPIYQINKCTSLTPSIRLAGSYDFKSNNHLTVMDMPESNTVYAIFGKRLHRAALKAGTGIGIQFKKAEITADYDIDWRVSHISQTGKIALKYHF